jgi:hypothetical protein
MNAKAVLRLCERTYTEELLTINYIAVHVSIFLIKYDEITYASFKIGTETF